MSTSADQKEARPPANTGDRASGPQKLPTKALASTTAIAAPDIRAVALASLAPHLPYDLCTQVVEQALDTVLLIPNRLHESTVLRDMAGRLSGLTPTMAYRVWDQIIHAAARDSPEALQRSVHRLTPMLKAFASR